MFQSLTDKLANAFKKFKNKGKLTEADVKEGMREVKLALLEADVNFKVVKNFTQSVTERAVGAEVLESLLPAQQIVKIVNEELIRLMGGETPADRLFGFFELKFQRVFSLNGSCGVDFSFRTRIFDIDTGYLFTAHASVTLLTQFKT